MENEKNLKATSQASYYGKAKIITDGDIVKLKSYNTIVASYNTKTQEFTRLWNGFSSTTQSHINDFRKLFNLEKLSKNEWLALPCESNARLVKIYCSNGFATHSPKAMLTENEAQQEQARLEKYYTYVDIV